MASKDNKTSKTARVMNLLSKKTEAAAEPETTPAPTAPVPPVISSLAPDAAVSVQIKNALEDELEAAPPAAQDQAAQPEPAPVAQPGPESEPMVQPGPGPVQADAPDPEPVPAPDPEPQPEAHEFSLLPSCVLDPTEPGYINVMQVLVEEKAPKYIQMFGLCQCKRCLEDVKALALNHLPPKYVVLEYGDMVPRLTVYEGKFSSDITAQLLQACKIVMQTPHHSREG